MSRLNTLLGLPPATLNILSGGFAIFLTCIGIRIVKAPNLALRVAIAIVNMDSPSFACRWFRFCLIHDGVFIFLKEIDSKRDKSMLAIILIATDYKKHSYRGRCWFF